MGGISPEHPVSLVSGTGMLKNLDPELFAGFPILISKTNRWIWPSKDAEDGAAKALVENADLAAACIETPPPGWLSAQFPDFKAFPHCDLMLIGLHGVGGEDGRLQGFFELAGQPFTGSGSLGSALAMDKITAKRIYQASGIPTARYQVLEKSEIESAAQQLEKDFGYPLVIKNPKGGSSLGMGIAHSRSDLEMLLKTLGADSERLLVEAYLKGKEGTCGYLSGHQALPPTEIRPIQDGFFNFEAKYKPGRTEEITPAQFPSEIIAEMQVLAARCHQALQLSVYSRTDFILVENALFVLETNNLPGFTPMSLLPQAAAYTGLDYRSLLSKIIEESLKK